MKKKMLTLWVMIALASCTGCVHSAPDFHNNLDSRNFEAYYQQDRYAPRGKKTAVYENKIYFLDTGAKGIVQMDFDGRNIEPIFSVPDTRKIQFTPEGVYYLGFSGIDANDDGVYRAHRLYLYDWETKKSQNLMETQRYAQIEEKDLELWDFYVTSNGTITNVSIDWGWNYREIAFYLYCVTAEGAVKRTEPILARGFRAGGESTIEGSCFSDICNIFIYDDLYFCNVGSLTIMVQDKEYIFGAPYYLAGYPFSVTDQRTNQYILGNDIYDRAPKLSNERTIDSFREDGVLIHVKNEVMLLTSDLQKVLCSTTLGDDQRILFVLDNKDKVYLITESKEKVQSLFLLDMNTFEYETFYICAEAQKILGIEFETEEKILWLDAGKMVTAQNRTIKIWELTERGYMLNRTVELAHKLVQKENKTDVAGDWLFLYGFSEQNNQDELLEKVNIGLE